MAASPLFVPVAPPRPDRPGPFWTGFIGERARNSVYGWSREAFDMPTRKRRVMGWTVHFPTEPEAIERVLLDHAERYEKPRIVKQLIAPLVGRGLLSSDGELWRGQRRIVAPTFAPGAVAKLAPLIARASERGVASWPATGEFDMAAEATRLTMAIITEALFSGDKRLDNAAAREHIAAALDAASAARIAAALRLPLVNIHPRLARGARGRKFMRRTLEAMVGERGIGGGPDDFLGDLIRALGRQYPPSEALALAADNAATFWVAGHETTANALAWTMYLLAAVPEIQDRARAEAVAALGGDTTGLADRLPYLRQVLDEALRLYPPAPRFDREAVAEDMLAGESVAPGDIVSIWPWLIHRQRRLWDDPDAFDPERFSPARKAAQHRFQYIPFGAGPRVCVGARFAIVEALVILAHWLAARRFALPEGRRVEAYGAVTLRPKDGLPLLLS